jgi:signal transduction histidine kinase
MAARYVSIHDVPALRSRSRTERGRRRSPRRHAGAMKQVDDRIYAMFAVAAAVASGTRRGSALDEIAAQARSFADVDAAAILELTGQSRFRIVGSDRLSEEYRRTLHEWHEPLQPGHGPSGLAVSEGRAVIATDFQNDPRFTSWAQMPLRDRWRMVVALPLIVDDTVLGTLVLYSTATRRWSEHETETLSFMADHAAVAIRNAQLIAEQQRQLHALERMVTRLQAQTHEHANRLHALAGLLILDDPTAALEFIQGLTSAHLSDRVALGDGTSTPVLALLRVEAQLARHRSVDLRIDVPKDLPPTPLSQAQAVTIVGNLLDNAMEAVAEMPSHRRRVDLTISISGEKLTIRVQDRGPGLPDDLEPFAPGQSSKPGHAGLGLGLVREAVIAAYGDVRIDRLPDGTAVEVAVPLLAAREHPPTKLRMLEGVDALNGD